MNPTPIRHAVALAFAATLAAGLAGCDNTKTADNRTVGQKIDQAGADIKQKTAEMKQDIKEATAEIKQDIKEATAKAKDSEVTRDIKEASGDALITAKVKTALIKEPGLSAMKIDVDTANGIVTLKGTVDSIDKSSRARELASTVDGVSSVDNRLIVGRTG